MQKLRRPMFWTWIAITVVIAGYIGLAAPFATYFGAEKAWVAAIVPPIMILLLGIGLAWLVFFVVAPARRTRAGDSENGHGSSGRAAT
jgi:hypothetical protein